MSLGLKLIFWLFLNTPRCILQGFSPSLFIIVIVVVIIIIIIIIIKLLLSTVFLGRCSEALYDDNNNNNDNNKYDRDISRLTNFTVIHDQILTDFYN